MSTQNINNLLDLFFTNYRKQKKDNVLLTSLKDPNNHFTWEKTFHSIKKLSSEIKKYTKKGDRCLLISENRPEWLISDLAIMLSYGITVPAYTTYTKKDYDFLINDCKPSVIIVSNKAQFDKIKDLIVKYNLIKLIISFDVIDSKDTKIYNFKKIFDEKK